MNTAPPKRQRRTLVRTRTVGGFQQALVELALAGDPLSARGRVLILPTRASIEVVRHTIEAEAVTRGANAIVLPDLLTRDGWIARLHQAQPGLPPMLTRIARETILARAATDTAQRTRMPGLPFHLRPGLVSEMLRFYDTLKLRQRTVRRFARALFDELRVELGMDRGSEGLIHQTAFLGFTFLAYERAAAESGGMDEHMLRRHLITHRPDLPVTHVVVAVADRSSDPRGLWPADFDLLGRLRFLTDIDVVMTDETHDAGFRDRLEGELPGIEESRFTGSAELAPPLLIVPEPRPSEMAAAATASPEPAPPLCFVSRDREEELRDVARAVRARSVASPHRPGVRDLAPTAVIFQRPLPYLYLALDVLADARVPFQTFDALPLASEPYAALVDLVLAVAGGGSREATVALLRSRLVSFEIDGTRIDFHDTAALEYALRERRAAGDASTYPDEIARWFEGRANRDGIDQARARRAAAAAAMIHAELAAYRHAAPASAQVLAVTAFLRNHNGPVPVDPPVRERTLRARAAALGVLDSLRDAFARHDDAPREPDKLTGWIHHAIELQTFAPRRDAGGLHLVDSVAARFGQYAHVHIVGLVETDWPERARPGILYTPSLLKSLGWPQNSDHARAEQAAFRDLLTLGRESVRLHAFQLDGDAVVARSPMIEAARGLRAVAADRAEPRAIFTDELLTREPPIAVAEGDEAVAWLGARIARPPLTDPVYAGVIEPRTPVSYRVSKVDQYVECPFKYFAQSVLGLPDEREETSGLTPLERGNLVHELFERFYEEWQAAGHGTITAATLPDALERFSRLTHAALARYHEPERALEQARLLGSLAARGIAEQVFELEVDEGGQVVSRLLEHELRGSFSFPLLAGLAEKTIQIRGKADRIDVFDDGSLRVIDYKLSRLPDTKTSVQIAVYAHCVRAELEARDGTPHPIDSASYLAFGDERQFFGRLGLKSEPASDAVYARAGEFARVIQRIENGEFPARPQRTAQCKWCRYAGVCRKEYRVDDDAAEPV